MTTFRPNEPSEVLSILRWAAAGDLPLEIVGHGTKRGIGRPAQTEHCIDLTKLTGVTLYEPEELVLSARAGTPVAEIEALLAERGQELAFDPIDYGGLLGGKARRRGTIGAVLAANLSGSRRIRAGAARDHILGIAAVSGRGEAFKAGGRVVKNVTGYDLSKGMAGSWGTLAVVTEVTFKVLPAAATETTLVLHGLLDDAAAAAMALAMGSAADVSGAAHLPEGISDRVGDGILGGGSATLFRIEGFGPSVSARVTLLRTLFNDAVMDELSARASKALWREVRDCAPFTDGSDRPVWRVSMAPSVTHDMVLALRMQAAVEVFYDWAGGLAWLSMEGDPEAVLLRRLIAGFGGGHATLVRAGPGQRASIPAFEPQPPALAALSARVKEQFDPKGILNPGRMG